MPPSLNVSFLAISSFFGRNFLMSQQSAFIRIVTFNDHFIPIIHLMAHAYHWENYKK
ncbi:hypothetical protein Hanom_Chr17g01529271 [Helianthus anomalus]